MKKYTVLLIDNEAQKNIAADNKFNEHIVNAMKYVNKLGPQYVTADGNTCAAEVIGEYEVKDTSILFKLLEKILRKK
jgi:hypothetical protein